jgi:demethylmenaquinone methyltransferase/2-methoxy-6-polyprenyl-1,4-benzoquinol methylase
MQTPHKSGHNAVLPDDSSKLSKTEQVARMFNGIAGRYDFLNHALSLGIDKGWRKKAIASILPVGPKNILDVATGTGDLALAAAHATGAHVIGVDISEGMLEVGRQKVQKNNLGDKVVLESGDSAAMSYRDTQFDAVMCAYGVRNFEHLEQGLKEMQRVMRPGGRLAILEFSRPKMFPVKQVFGFYFKHVLPALGNLVSKHGRAYTYLNESAMAFPEGAEFVRILERCGFTGVKAQPLTFGITTLYTASK